MPLTEPDNYHPPLPLRNPHLQMIVASVLRHPHDVLYEREQLELPDGDFIALDWLRQTHARRLAVLLHGLESSSRAPYMCGIVSALHRRGWDCVVINARGCSGEPNRLLRAYHSGETSDPNHAIEHIRANHNYFAIAMIGFSLGGNVALRYAGEHGKALINQVAAVAAVSVPCELVGCAQKLDLLANRI
jgi:predicted alpha/beta-fold hydrolase